MLLRFSMAFAMAASLAGCAHAYSPIERGPELLSELPANAPPGECYARVRVPGEPAGPPPMMMGAQWVLNPGPPGSPGPIWCLVPTGPVPAAAAPTVERYGWIRVLCDSDATPDRIRGVQHRLHERGYYRGEATGRYDAATAAAVGQFQSSAHIGHGGYLSLQTLDVLEQQGGYASAPVYAGGYGYAPAPSPCVQTCGYPAPPPPPVYYQPCCQQPVYQQPVYQQPVYAPPTYARPCCAAPQAYQGAGYVQGYYAAPPVPAYAAASAQAQAQAYAGGGGASAYASSTSAVQNGWLTWGGMSRY